MNNLFNGIYKDKKVLITGHTGFKGSWLLLWLLQLKAKVIGYSLPPNTNPNHIDLLNDDYINIYGDVRDFFCLQKVIFDHKPDIIFHLAAQPLVIESYKNSLNTFETNLLGTVNLLEICKKATFVQSLIIVTSDKCYENNETKQAFKEGDPLGGKDPYSASKACVEIITQSYKESFFHMNNYLKTHNLLIATARAGNVIGGGDWSDYRIIPDIMKATFNGHIVSIRNPNAIRPWQFVLESISGYLALGQKLLEKKALYAQSWNFGPDSNSNQKVLDIINNLQSHWKKIKYVILDNSNVLKEANFLKLDSSKAINYLGWQPIYDLEKTLQNTINWYQNFYENNKILSSDQLKKYIYTAKNKKVDWAQT